MGGLTDALLLTYHITGDVKYLAPVRSMARIALRYADKLAGKKAFPGSEAWCAARMGFLSGTLPKFRLFFHMTQLSITVGEVGPSNLNRPTSF